MNADEIVAELRPLGSESYKAVMRRHGVPEPLFGVKVEELKKVQKRIKTTNWRWTSTTPASMTPCTWRD